MKPLNPIMAVLVIASVGASPLRTHAADGNPAPAPVAATEDKNPVNAMAKIFAENPAARKDAGQRIADFLLKPDSTGKSFVGDGVDRAALEAVAREWGETSGGPGTVAVLYFVAGPGPVVPGWAVRDPLLSKTFTSGMKWEGRLRLALEDWTGKSQIDKTKEKTQVTAFLNDAAAKASTVFDDRRTKEEIDLSIAGNDTTAPVVPDTTRSPGTRLDGATRQYTLDDLYRTGAKVVNVSGPKDPHSRTISMKIYTRRTPPPDSRIINEIGIFDITDTNDIFGQRFPIDSGDKSFILDDRTPGHKKYELKFGPAGKDGNRTITFARPGGGVPLTTTVSDLFKDRADQAAGMGNIVKVGGQEFYTLPQGGALSALALFPKALIDGRGTGDARDLSPSMYAEVGKRGSDGRNENLGGKPPLGKVGDKEFHLAFNKALGVWEVKEGPGDPPPAPPATGDGTTPGGANPGGANPGGANPGGGAPTEGEMSIADLEALLLKSPECTKNPDDIKDLAPSLKGKYGIITCSNEIDGRQQIILVPKSATAPGQQLRYGNVPNFRLLRARFYDHYLVLQFDKQVQYLDLLKQGKDGDGKDTGFALSGFVAEKNASKFDDSGAFVDALRHYMGTVPAAALTEVPRRVQASLGGKPYNLTGAFPKDVLVVTVTSGGDTFMVWPELKQPGAEPVPTPNPYTSLSGPANAMDGAVSSVDDTFRDKIDLPESRQAKAVKVQADIALYESVDLNDKPEPKKYFVTFRYKALDPTEAKVFRQKPFEVFNSSNPYPGAGLQMQGLTAAPAVDDRVASGYKFVSGSTKERGVLAVFQNKQVSANNAKKGAANCVGPVLWWGLKDRDAALKACQDDKF